MRIPGLPRHAQKRSSGTVSCLRRACDVAYRLNPHSLSDRVAQAAAIGVDRIGRGCSRRDLGHSRPPGLRRLWAPFHVAEPTGVITAPTLLARLARALFDPEYADPDGFVEKGRALFAAAKDRFDDVCVSRQIGGLLGNDLGQMRVQFNARTYVVEPVYRDDGLGLWDFGDQAPAQDDTVELMVEAARIERRDEASEPDRRREEAEPAGDAVGRARERPADERGPIVATYPEWDCDAETERPDWTTVRAAPVGLGNAGAIDAALDDVPAVRARIRRLVRGARVRRHERLKRRSDGPELDLDAALDAAISLRAAHLPDDRVFRTMARRKRDLSVTILLDARNRRATGSHHRALRCSTWNALRSRPLRKLWPRSMIRSHCAPSLLQAARMSASSASRISASLTALRSKPGSLICGRNCRPGWGRRCVMPALKSRQ